MAEACAPGAWSASSRPRTTAGAVKLPALPPAGALSDADAVGGGAAPGSTAPGGELLERFGSDAAKTPGSSNVWGISDPAIDALLQKIVSATTRPDLAAAARALDRVLTHGHYSVPQYYGDAFLIGYRPGQFVLPDVIPPYYQADTWAMTTWWPSGNNK